MTAMDEAWGLALLLFVAAVLYTSVGHAGASGYLAAMALYGRRFILLKQKDVRLPSNLSGLYEVRYECEKLDVDATLKLLKAFNDFKTYKPPTSTPST